MKKNLFVIAAIAVTGLFASCQKENTVAPEQAAVEQNIVAFDINGVKGDTDLEPLYALEEVLADSKGIDWNEIEKKAAKILLNFLREVGQMIGAGIETPVHTYDFYGDWENFGLAFDQIKQVSYNFSDAKQEPYSINLQFGDAKELLVSDLEILPVKNFAANLSVRTKAGNKANVIISNALVVKFSYKKRIAPYAFVLYAEASEGAGSNGLHLGFIYGDYTTDMPLIDVYRNFIKNSIKPIYEFILPIYPTTSLQYDVNRNSESYHILAEDIQFESEAYNDMVTINITNDKGRIGWGATLTSKDKDAVKDYFRDYLKASVLGGTESEVNSLSEQFFKVFPVENGNNVMKVSWAPFTTYLSVAPEAASGMVWKPALGVDLKEEPLFVSFAEMNDMTDEEFKNFQNYYLEFGINLN